MANTYFQPPRELFARLEGLARAGGAERLEFGKSVEGRNLTAYLYLDQAPENAPLVLVTSGFHPAEPDTLATQAILEYLAGEEGRALRKKLRFAVVPVMNPDGFIHGPPGQQPGRGQFLLGLHRKRRGENPGGGGAVEAGHGAEAKRVFRLSLLHLPARQKGFALFKAAFVLPGGRRCAGWPATWPPESWL